VTVDKRNKMSIIETSCFVLDLWLPRVLYGKSSITARTCILLQLASLFSASKRVVIDAESKTVTISSRRLWFLSESEIVSFNKIRYIDISEITVGTNPGYTPDGVGWHDQEENFIPYLMTIEGKKVDLVSFYGEGAIQTGWWGIILGDHIIDFKGRQEKRAREFIAKAAAMIGVPCGVDSEILSKARSAAGRIRCDACGHFNAETYGNCLYCGVPLKGRGGPP
jgi:hypothetical protein